MCHLKKGGYTNPYKINQGCNFPEGGTLTKGVTCLKEDPQTLTALTKSVTCLKEEPLTKGVTCLKEEPLTLMGLTKGVT